MPKDLKRFYGNGDLHFVTASCYRRQPLLGSLRRRDLFLKVLADMRQRYGFVVVGYVVMPEHFHLLISEPEHGNPSVVIQSLKLGVQCKAPLLAKNARNGAPSGFHNMDECHPPTGSPFGIGARCYNPENLEGTEILEGIKECWWLRPLP